MVELRNPLTGWKRKISRIDRMALVDCVPSAQVFVMGVAVAAFHVFWALAGPECIDSTWDRVNKTGKKHRKFKANGFGTGPTINPPSGSLGTTMVSIGNAAQKIGFAMGLVDGVLNGVYYGASLMRRYTGCKNPTAPYAQLTSNGFVPAPFPAATFIYASWLVEDAFVFAADAGGVNVGSDPNDYITIGYGLEQEFNVFPPLTDCTFTHRLVWLPSGDPVRGLWGGGPNAFSGSGVIFGNDIFKHVNDNFVGVLCEKTEGVLYIKTGFLTVTGGKIDSGLAAYDCGAKIGVI